MRILYSTSRIALRNQTLREVCSLTSDWPDRRAILLVPEQTKMDMERDYLAMADQSGLMMADVLSFRRLAWRILGEIGRQPRQAIDSVGQGMLIHRVLTRSQPELHSYGHLADRPGFIRQAAAVLGDLKRYRVDSGQLRQAAAAADDKALRDKSHDLAVLLSGYDAALAETGLCDAEDDLNRLGEALKELCSLPHDEWPWPLNRLAWLRQSSIWISGFGELRDFTPQEDTILQALDCLCPDITLTVIADYLPFDHLAVDSGTGCFLAGRKTAWRLLQSFPGSPVQKIPDPTGGRAAEIARSFREGEPCGKTELESDQAAWLQLIRANGVDAELAALAGEIRRLVQEDGCRYRDITLAVCDLPAYIPRLRAIFREYGIPLFLDAGRQLSGTPLVRFVLALLDVGLHNWPLSSIMTCLRAGMTPLEPSEIDLLENEMLSRGISRPDRLFDDARYSSPAILASRDKAFSPWREVLASLKSAVGGAEKCRTLYDFLQAYGLPTRLEQRSAQLAASGDMDAAVAQIQAWNELLRVLKQMSRLTGDLAMPLQTFRDLLAAGLDAAASGVIPSAIDQVTVGDLKRAMLRQPRVLFLVGATADSLPPRLPPEGLLKDQDRQALSGLIGRQLPSSVRDQAFADAFVLYSLLTLPTWRLCVTAPSDAVSQWFSWLADAENAKIPVMPDRPSWDDVRLNAVRPAFGFLLGHSGHSEFTEDQKSHEGWLAVGRVLLEAGMPLQNAADWLRRAAQPGRASIVRIPAGLVRALFAGQPAMSVSQLENYAGCPFRYLATYLLALQEREVWAPESAESGTLLHGIVEMAMDELRRDLSGLEPTDREGYLALIDRWLRGGFDLRVRDWMRLAADRDRLQMFFDNGIQASSGRRVRRLAVSSIEAILRQYQKETYRPAFLEWNFGPSRDCRLAVPLPDGTIIDFRGKVDRVDLRTVDDGRGFRIVDYKSGDKKADFEALYHGLALQLPIYLEAFSRSNPDCFAEDAAYFHFTRPMLNLQAGARPDAAKILASLEKSYALRGMKLAPDDIGLLRRHALRRATGLASCLLDGDFEVVPRRLPGKEPACIYCPMQAVCGFDGSPGGCRWLPGLRGRKREEYILRVQEIEIVERGPDDAAHT